MWTPKRIVLLVVGFFLFCTAYVGYAHFMGGIDGLPALPEVYWPQPGKPLKLDPWKQPINEADKRLRQAFGDDCEEVKRGIRVVLNDRGLVLATDECNPQEDGRVKLEPFSIAIFSKPKPGAPYPEINTIRCNTALVTFDRPVKNQMEMGGRKIVGGELQGTITIINNRGTPQKTDDIEVTVMGKPLFYTEPDHHVWSEGTVRMLDTQNVPYPTRVTANGIDLYLTTGPKPGQAEGGKAKGKADSISGVDRVILRRNVHMNLYVDAKNGFPGAAPGGPASKAPPRTRPSEKMAKKPGMRDPRALTRGTGKPLDPDRAYLVIDTSGPFHYDLKKDLATFDIPPGGKDRGNLDYQVIVCREHNPGQGKGPLFDQLVCKHLELQFRRKKVPEQRPAGAGRSVDREIESAHAVGEVRLALDTESLEAQGDDLVYVAPTPDKGPQTTLVGAPLWAVKDCNVIQAKRLWLLGAGPDGKTTARATAQGPGRIDLADHPSDNPRHPIHVYWKDMLISAKDGIYDQLTLTGGASFVDDDHKQQLHGKRLEIWLEPGERATPPSGAQEALRQATPASADRTRQRPHRLEAYQHVSAHSPDMNIQQADRLTVWFHNVAPAGNQLPGAATGPTGTSAAGAGKSSASAPAPGGTGRQKEPAAANGSAPAEPPKKPVDLKARVVVAHVNRAGEKNELKGLVSEGNVHVHQEGKDANDRGVEITGETLELVHFLEGDKLVVLGNTRQPAYLQLGELILVGPKVTIDQKENSAEVQGLGYMNMPSNSSFEEGLVGPADKKPAGPPAQAAKAGKPPTRLEVHWNTGMVFDGKDANFYGGVIATQDAGRLKGNTLQVTLDRSVSLKEGQKKGQSAKVEKMVCDGKVYVEDTTRDEKGKLVRYSRLVCHGLSMDNQPGVPDRQGAPTQPGTTLADGPGVVYLMQPGPVDNANGPAPAPEVRNRNQAPAKQQEEMKVTRIDFETRMRSDNQGANRRAIFYDNIEVINVPADNPDVQVDKDHLPLRGMYLRASDKLTVFNTSANGKPSQVMIAEGKVTVTTPEFQAHAMRVSYEESKDLLIFEGTDQNQASFYRIGNRPGLEKDSFRGRKIFFWRSTRQFKIEDGGSILNFK